MANRSPFDPDDLDGLAKDFVRELKATGELVSDAAKQGKEELRQYVSENLQSTSESIRAARERYSEAFQKEMDRFEEQRRQRNTEREKGAAKEAASAGKKAEGAASDHGKAKAASAADRKEKATAPVRVRARKRDRIRNADRFSGFWLTVGSAFLLPGLLFGIEGVYELLSGALEEGIFPAAVMFILAGVFPFISGVKRWRKGRLYDRYRTFVGDEPSMSLKEIAAQMDRSFGKALTELSDMVNRGYFGPEAVLDSAAGLLILDPEKAAKAQAKKEAAAAESEKSEEDRYDALLIQLRRLNERIPGEEMTRKIARIEAVARSTFAVVREHPEKESQIRRFMDYYLPTTIKLLDAYAGFEQQEVSGENIRQSRESIEKMMTTLADAFEKQFDSLYKAENLDINTEIRAMDSLLRQDGYVGGMAFHTEE